MMSNYFPIAVWILGLGFLLAAFTLSKDVSCAFVLLITMAVLSIIYMLDKVILLLAGLYIDEDEEGK